LFGNSRLGSQKDEQVSSQEDLALGYFMGSLMNIACNIARQRKLVKKVDARYKKRMEKIIKKVEVKKEVKKRGRPLQTELNEKELESIRDMLIPMIAEFREKIRKEIALGKVPKS